MTANKFNIFYVLIFGICSKLLSTETLVKPATTEVTLTNLSGAPITVSVPTKLKPSKKITAAILSLEKQLEEQNELDRSQFRVTVIHDHETGGLSYLTSKSCFGEALDPNRIIKTYPQDYSWCQIIIQHHNNKKIVLEISLDADQSETKESFVEKIEKASTILELINMSNNIPLISLAFRYVDGSNFSYSMYQYDCGSVLTIYERLWSSSEIKECFSKTCFKELFGNIKKDVVNSLGSLASYI